MQKKKNRAEERRAGIEEKHKCKTKVAEAEEKSERCRRGRVTEPETLQRRKRVSHLTSLSSLVPKDSVRNFDTSEVYANTDRTLYFSNGKTTVTFSNLVYSDGLPVPTTTPPPTTTTIPPTTVPQTTPPTTAPETSPGSQSAGGVGGGGVVTPSPTPTTTSSVSPVTNQASTTSQPQTTSPSTTSNGFTTSSIHSASERLDISKTMVFLFGVVILLLKILLV